MSHLDSEAIKTKAPADVNLTSRRHCLVNTLVFAGIVSAYLIGIVLLAHPAIRLNVLGLCLVSYSIILTAYFKHEALHGIALPQRRWNSLLGQILSWIDGTCYGSWDALVKEHMAHHQGKDVRPAVDFADTPQWLRQLLLALEWCHIPAASLMIFVRLHVGRLFNRDHQFNYLRWVTFLRMSGFLALGLVSLKALCLYVIAFNLSLIVLRFQAAFQHSQDYWRVSASERDSLGTFSPLISERYPWLNGLLLNFGYHSAHHYCMTCPWYALPQLDRELIRQGKDNHLLEKDLLADYHHYRLLRIQSSLGWLNAQTATTVSEG